MERVLLLDPIARASARLVLRARVAIKVHVIAISLIFKTGMLIKI